MRFISPNLPLNEVINVARTSSDAVRTSPSQSRPRASQGPSFIPPHPFLLFLSFPASHPFSQLALPQDIPGSAGKHLRTCPGPHLLRYLASSPCMAAAAAWGEWECLRICEGYFRGPGQSTPKAEAVTVPRPARRGGSGGGGAAVTTVSPPAPPTAPGPQNTGAAQTRPEPSGPDSPQGACAHATAPVCAGSVGGPGSCDKSDVPRNGAERDWC